MTSRQLTTHRRILPTRSTRKLPEEIQKLQDKISLETKFSIISKAVNEVIELKAGNSGNTKYGDIQSVINKYQLMGYDFVTRGSVCYRLDNMKKTSSTDVLNPSPNTINVDSDDSETFDHPRAKKKNVRKVKIETEKRIQIATTKAAEKFKEAKSAAERKRKLVSNGTLKNICKSMEDEYALPEGSINSESVRKRVARNNVSGVKPQTTSPLDEVEPIIVEYCIRLANMGAALDKEQCLSLVNSSIEGTSHQEYLSEFKKKRKLDDDESAGNGWYRGFIERNSDYVVRKNGRIKDLKRHTWCTYENFERMYNSIYRQMVNSNVAKELSDEVYLDRNGNIVDDEEDSYGLPTKYIVTHPDYILFVDECGKNTNMKTSGKAGGQRFIIPKNSVTNTGCLGTTTDIHFTVLCFTAGTGEPVMCAVIFKSEKNVSDIPLYWKTGINIKYDLHTGKNEYETFILNQGEGKAL